MSVEHHVVELATLAADPHVRICPYKGVVSAARISCIVAHNISCGICYQLHVERVVLLPVYVDRFSLCRAFDGHVSPIYYSKYSWKMCQTSKGMGSSSELLCGG